MKMEIFVFATLFAAPSVASSATITVSAYIDGLSSLVFHGDTVHWHHTAWAAPGRWNDNDLPTTINGHDWIPTWPALGRNDFCDCDSSSISGLFPALPLGPTTFTLDPLNSPGPVTILEQPSSINGYSLVVEFDDYSRGGASWYNIELTYSAVPLPASAWLFGTALSALALRARERRQQLQAKGPLDRSFLRHRSGRSPSSAG